VLCIILLVTKFLYNDILLRSIMFFLSHDYGSKKLSCSRFTLLELLIVISCIAILAALLLPSLSNARERGLSANCAGGVRQFVFYQLQYSQDYSGFLPYNVNYSAYPWMALRNYNDTFRGYGIVKGSPGVPINKKSILNCPKNFKHPRNTTSTGQTYYLWPQWSDESFYGRRRGNTMDLRNPKQKIIMLEAARHSSGKSTTRYYWSLVNVFPHNDFNNVAFWDGHVMALKEEAPYFFVSTDSAGKNGLKSANSKQAKPHWDYAY